MSQRVQVAIRLRPYNDIEKRVGGPVAATQEGECIVVHGDRSRQHTYDLAFGPDDPQELLFEKVGAPAVKKVLEGYNGTVLAYGQTGSGKTHTMLGPGGGAPEALDSTSSLYRERGLIPRMVDSLFVALSKIDPSEVTWSLGVSVFELYKELLYDSLTDCPRDPSEYRIREDVTGGKGIYVDNLYEKTCSSASEVLQAIRVGASRRRVASTNANETSSRSHSITLMSLHMTNHLMGDAVTHSKLTLVDLAGSEKVAKTNAGGDRLKEAQAINLSLTLLGNVIYKLTDGKSSYIPYRDSKLTRLLQDSLGGNSCTTLLCCASPAAHNKEETITTLAFAARAKQITNKPRINRDLSDVELRAALAKALEEITDLKDRLSVQSEFISRQMRNHPSPRSARNSQQDATLPGDAQATEVEEPEPSEDLQAIIDRLMAENSELRREIQDLKAQLLHGAAQLEFHKERANTATEKVAELQSKIKREESLFERRVAELTTVVPFSAAVPLPPDSRMQEVQVMGRGGQLRRTNSRGSVRLPVEATSNSVTSRRTSVPVRELVLDNPTPPPSVAEVSVATPPTVQTLPATDTAQLIRLEQLNAEVAKLKAENERLKAGELSSQSKIRALEGKCESLSSDLDTARSTLDETLLKLSNSERMNADMKRILDALNIDIEEQLQIERNRTAAASSEASSLRGKNVELLEAQSQQEFCDIAMAELLFKAEDMDAIENEVVAIRFTRQPPQEIEALRASCLRTLEQLDDFLQTLSNRISDRRFATANLETCRLNIITDAVSLQNRVATAKQRLKP